MFGEENDLEKTLSSEMREQRREDTFICPISVHTAEPCPSKRRKNQRSMNLIYRYEQKVFQCFTIGYIKNIYRESRRNPPHGGAIIRGVHVGDHMEQVKFSCYSIRILLCGEQPAEGAVSLQNRGTNWMRILNKNSFTLPSEYNLIATRTHRLKLRIIKT